MSSLLNELLEAVGALDEKQKQAVVDDAIAATADLVWVPNPGPQTGAFFCEADETFYGGQAGGGKTDLACGLALTSHHRSLLLRRINKDAVKLVPRIEEILGNKAGYNGQLQRWKINGRQIDIAGCEQETDKQRFKGDPHDLIVFDEGTDFLESQYRFIIGWNRSAKPGQRCRVLVTSNPPTTAQGLWVIKYWGPWLDPTYPRPAVPGELRWFTTINGADTEVDGPGPHEIPGETKPVVARSRTYLPAALSDNPDLVTTNYASVLAGLPEELRRAYRDGDFSVGLRDADFQCIPTAWIDLAQQRWKPDGYKGLKMTAIGLDVAPGGTDSNQIAPRYGGWYPPLIGWKGVDKDGSAIAGKVVQHRRDNCPVIVDVGGGWGGDALIHLKDNNVDVVAFNGVVASSAKTRDGKLNFYNKRAESYWRFREALDPNQEGGSSIALPPDTELKSDLTAPTWRLTKQGILLEAKEDIIARIGRSPDKGDAVVMSLSEGNSAVRRALHRGGERELPTTANLGYSSMKRR